MEREREILRLKNKIKSLFINLLYGLVACPILILCGSFVTHLNTSIKNFSLKDETIDFSYVISISSIAIDIFAWCILIFIALYCLFFIFVITVTFRDLWIIRSYKKH